MRTCDPFARDVGDEPLPRTVGAERRAYRRCGRRFAASRAAIREAVRLAGELNAPITFIYVRRGPAGFFGAPVYQRRLSKEMARARRVVDRALVIAEDAGIASEGEILVEPR